MAKNITQSKNNDEYDFMLRTLALDLMKAKRTLTILEEQAAGYTILTVPIHVVLELEDKRREISKLGADLAALQVGITTYQENFITLIQSRQRVVEFARRSLVMLEDRNADFTVLTRPAHLTIELEDKRQGVARGEAELESARQSAGLSLSPDLCQRLWNTLATCDIFESDDTLRAFFDKEFPAICADFHTAGDRYIIRNPEIELQNSISNLEVEVVLLEGKIARYASATVPVSLEIELEEKRQEIVKLKLARQSVYLPQPEQLRGTLLITFLRQKNILIIFLRVLSARYHSKVTFHNTLIEIADELENALGLALEESFTAAAKNRESVLDLSGLGITRLPLALFQLTYLESLNLSQNALLSLPPEIGHLLNLRHLDLSQNRLTSLPLEISLLRLETLAIQGNPLPIPEEILTLPSRGKPKISTLTAKKLQDVLHKVDAFRSDRSFRAAFADNRLLSWRDQIPKAPSVTERVPVTIDYLTRQSSADGENALVLFLQALTELTDPADVLYIALKDLTVRLQQELSHSQLIPPSVLFNYLFPTTQRALNEVKVLLVGEGGVGKTSLVKRLMGQPCDPGEKMTEGILVEQWYVPLGNESLRLNIWDFGGQEIMHATHQFFLTRRSLYLVVIDARTGERGLDYWLQIVRSYGGDSPIFVVINKDEIRHIELNTVALRKKYPNICAIIPTSCADETHLGIEQLRQAILGQVAQMSHVHTLWPGAWFVVKTRLEQLERDYISFGEYADICAEAGIADTDNHTLITFLHDLGIVLNYYDDPRLQETNILNPAWVTQAVYTIINARQIAENGGILERTQLGAILRDHKGYPHYKHGFILTLMCKFELGFPLDKEHKRYLIPDLLPKNEILLDGWPPETETFFFQYQYSIFPSSIITRLIAQMHPYIHHSIVWRTGVCLKYQDNFALIKADETTDRLTIAIIGNTHTRREFLAILRERLREIHASFEALTISEYVAIPGYPDLYEKYNQLLKLERLGQRTFVPEDLEQPMSLAAILDSVVAPEERGALFGISESLLIKLQQALVVTGFCADFLTLRRQLDDSPIALWSNALRAADNTQAQAYEIIRNFHNRTNTSGENGLDLFLKWLIDKITDESQRKILIGLSLQIVSERAAYHTAPSTSGANTITYHITVKDGGQIGVIGSNSKNKGGVHFQQAT